MNLSPAATVIRAFGGVRPLARVLGKAPSSICRWQRPRKRGGREGTVPASDQRRLLEVAAALGVKLTADDLVHGRAIAD